MDVMTSGPTTFPPLGRIKPVMFETMAAASPVYASVRVQAAAASLVALCIVPSSLCKLRHCFCAFRARVPYLVFLLVKGTSAPHTHRGRPWRHVHDVPDNVQ